MLTQFQLPNGVAPAGSKSSIQATSLLSLSVIVSTASGTGPRITPLDPLSVSTMASLPSTRPSSTIGTLKLWLFSPSANIKVPFVAV